VSFDCDGWSCTRREGDSFRRCLLKMLRQEYKGPQRPPSLEPINLNEKVKRVTPAALYHEIVARPEDRDLRLAYARALEEAGDLRGEFVRLQLQLTTLDDELRRSELEARMTALLLMHGSRWLSPNSRTEWDWDGTFLYYDPLTPHFHSRRDLLGAAIVGGRIPSPRRKEKSRRDAVRLPV
jgi:uncharacterized protein (TIGR02996 family)